MDVKLSCCEISAADIEPLMSCLLANTRTAAFRNSYCLKKEQNIMTIISWLLVLLFSDALFA